MYSPCGLLSSPESLVRSIQGVARSLDPELPLDRIATMDHLLDLELKTPRLNAILTSSFSLIALLLAAAGVYSVFAAFVAQRLPELGIRSALGATPARLRSLVLNRSRNLVLAGVVIGGLGAFFLSRLLESFLYGVEPFDIPTLHGRGSRSCHGRRRGDGDSRVARRAGRSASRC